MKNTVALTATGQAIPAGAGTIDRIIVNTHSSGVIRLNDSPNSSTGRVILADTTLPTGAQTFVINADYSEGVYLTLVSGTATVQLVYNQVI